MHITRNGINYELTHEEMRNIFTAMKREYFEEDIMSKAEDMEIEIPEDRINGIVNYAEKCLDNNDSYWESYWMSIEYAINEKCADMLED